ncbi:MAG: 50S ribosomal protein L29 [Bradymonadales bacterium]|jgi:ribosomal protein L29
MKASEIREKSNVELVELLDTNRKNLFAMKMQKYVGQADTDTSKMLKVRKDIARIMTVLRQRELEG